MKGPNSGGWGLEARAWAQGARRWVLGACVCLTASPGFAQESSRFEVGVGALWTGASSYAPVDATETGSTGNPFPLFSTKSDLAASIGVESRLAVRLSKTLQIEGLGAYSKPHLVTRISEDFESAAATTTTEETIRVRVEGAIVAHLLRWRIGTHAVPFVTGGGGYVRELHEGQTIVKTGRSYFLGGGLRYSVRARPGGYLKMLGFRGDVKAVIRRGGLSLDDRVHVTPAVAASVFLGF